MAVWSTKREINASSPRSVAGVNQEKDVAFYLRRAFKDKDRFIVFNDYSFEYDDEKAQIDHLIIHRYGFTILESKSITGEVTVNSKGEWSRSYGRRWSGMPSPLKQAELQLKLLKKMLVENAEHILPKMFGLQQNFGGRQWDSFCVVSSNAILHRDSIPKELDARIIKSEFVGDAVRSLGEKSLVGAVFNTDPAFNASELKAVGEFLLAKSADRLTLTEQAPVFEPASTAAEKPKSREEADALWKALKKNQAPVSADQQSDDPRPEKETPDRKVNHKPDGTRSIVCKQCGEGSNLVGQYGRYGYYIHCKSCNANTSMKQACQVCGSTDTKITKRKEQYTLNCKAGHSYLVFEG